MLILHQQVGLRSRFWTKQLAPNNTTLFNQYEIPPTVKNPRFLHNPEDCVMKPGHILLVPVTCDIHGNATMLHFAMKIEGLAPLAVGRGSLGLHIEIGYRDGTLWIAAAMPFEGTIFV